MSPPCCIRYHTAAEAKTVIELLDGKALPGSSTTLSVRYSGDGVPLVAKAQKKLQAGEQISFGVVRSFDADRKFGFVYCEDIMRTQQTDVYVHHTTISPAKAAPGDSVAFFLFWKGEKAQCQPPMIRLAAECQLGMNNYALKGWFKGVADPERGFGFIQCAELTTLFGRDVYVHKDVCSGMMKPGWVKLNV